MFIFLLFRVIVNAIRLPYGVYEGRILVRYNFNSLQSIQFINLGVTNITAPIRTPPMGIPLNWASILQHIWYLYKRREQGRNGVRPFLSLQNPTWNEWVAIARSPERNKYLSNDRFFDFFICRDDIDFNSSVLSFLAAASIPLQVNNRHTIFCFK